MRKIKESYNKKADNNSFILRNIFRPGSFYLAYLLMGAGVSANLATIFGLVVGLISLLFFAMSDKVFYLGTLFYILYWFFDFADGNIARVSNSASYYGKFLDGMVDALIETLLPLSIAIGLFIKEGDIFYIAVGTSISVSLLFAFFAINRISFFKRWIEIERGSGGNTKELNPLKSTRLPMKKIFNFQTDFKISLLLAATFTGMNKVLYIIFAISIFIWAVILIIAALQDARKNLRHARTSRLDARFTDQKQVLRKGQV
ncbi:MAG: CDP-alcohol phosphatidyltransferase family protein [Candidatus Omnitrophica bacterium]|nr:CDP-alcohol phosphatidyltransferase family protein [Candidatus Omnitrophota bacterium]